MIGILAAMLLAACGGGNDDAVTTKAAAPAAAAPTAVVVVADAKPVEARLIMAQGIPSVESNNPWRNESPRTPWFFAATHESLIGADADTGEHIPQLAEAWNVEPDGMSVRFKLRKGIRFHGDNGEFSAQDVIATKDAHTAEDSRHTHRSQYRGVTIEVVNPYEIVYRLVTPNPEILNNTSSWNVTSMEPFSAKDMASLGGNPDLTMRPPAGTGAFQFLERTQGVEFIVERVPYDHWRYNSDWEEIEFRFANEASTRLAALLTGEVHVTSLPLDLQNQAEDQGMAVATGQVLTRQRSGMFQGPVVDKSYANYEKQNTACGYVHCDDAFLDLKVRRAFNKAVDRAAINTAFFGGKGIENHNPHFVPTRAYWNPEWDAKFDEEYGYDPVKAKALLAEAGYNASNPLKILVDGTPSSGLPEKADVMEAMAGYWHEIGVKVEMDLRDSAATRAIDRGFGMTNRIQYMTSNIVGLQSFRVHHWTNGSPRAGFELKEMTELVDWHRGSLDPAVITERMRTTGDVTFGLHIQIPLVWKPEELAYNPNVVASYEWSGVPLGTVSHFERFMAVKK
jgi:ABC-type transport system substrate-binding protein